MKLFDKKKESKKQDLNKFIDSEIENKTQKNSKKKFKKKWKTFRWKNWRKKKKMTKLIQKNYSLIEKKIENKSDIKNLEKELEEK